MFANSENVKDGVQPAIMKPGGRKVLLIFPHPVSQPPGGLAAIAPIFQQYGYDVKIIVNTFQRYLSNEAMLALAREYQPDIVGLSFITFRLLDTYDLMQRLKETGALVLAGGAHPTIRPEESLDHGADLVVMGEGEVTLAELCRYWEGSGPASLADIPGLCFKDGGGSIQYTGRRARIKDLDNYPLPDIKSYDLDLFRMPDGSIKAGNKVFMSRGCPFQCTFCDKSVFGPEHVTRSAARIVDQIVHLQQEYGYDEMGLDDDNFMLNKNLARQVCHLILDRGIKVRWLVASHINTADQDLLRLMKEAGCFQVIYGAESGDNDTLKRIRKGYTREDIIEAVRLTHSLGLKIYINLMTGFPWETPHHVQNTIDLIEEISPMVYAFQCYGAVVPYPNTALYEQYKEEAGLENWWLKPKFQDVGMVIFQNVADPYRNTSYFQRNLYDDTYIYEDYFFQYSPEYKQKVKEMLFLLGRHNLKARYLSPLKQRLAYGVGKVSRFFYEINPCIERNLVSLFHPKNLVHDVRGVATFVKK
jgi:radical SAM superfamily enzyme YgiQ (UPF0313 family)